MGALPRVTPPAPLVRPASTSSLQRAPACPPVGTMPPTTIWMARPASSAAVSARPAVVPKPTTASHVPLGRRSSSTVPSVRPPTASTPVGQAPSPRPPTAGVTLLDSVCASNCEACSSAASADCSRCLSGFFLQPSSNVCLASCPSGYYGEPSSTSCLPCDSACSGCSSPGPSGCTACASHFFSSAGSCLVCDSACAECSGTDPTSCTTCASSFLSV